MFLEHESLTGYATLGLYTPTCDPKLGPIRECLIELHVHPPPDQGFFTSWG